MSNKTFIAAALFLVAISAVFVFFGFKAKVNNKNQATQAKASQTQQAQTSTAPEQGSQKNYTILESPAASFPKELIPAGATAPQYWENPTAAGGMFVVKKGVDQTIVDYKAGLTGSGWTATSSKPFVGSGMIYLEQKEKNQKAIVSFDAIPTGVTAVDIRLLK